jgi:hypothetical protein
MKKIFLLFSLLLMTGFLVMGQTSLVTGKVTSSDDGSELPGVFVTVKGTTLGTITGPDGNSPSRFPLPAERWYSALWAM